MNAFVAIGPTELFVAAWCNKYDKHVEDWRYHNYTKQANLHVIDYRLHRALREPVEL